MPRTFDPTPFIRAFADARSSDDLGDLLTLAGLLTALSHTCNEAIRARLLPRPADGDPAMLTTDDERTAQEMAAATHMSAAYFYRHAHRLPYVVRHGRAVRFSWSGYLKCRARQARV